ncbi:MAG: 2-phospho-L-lactate guanylyltransferase [Chloroflexota bacterium]
MSGIWAIVPVKALERGKSRLATRFTVAERRELSLAMLEDVLSAILQAQSIAGCVVVHSDAQVKSIAERLGLAELQETGAPADLNAALRQGLTWLDRLQPDGVLIIPADVPLVTASALEQLVRASSGARVLTICPSLDRTGTNALLVRPPSPFLPLYGIGSFQAHVEQAEVMGATLNVLDLPSIALDLDEPRDVEQFLDIDSDTRTRAVLARMNRPSLNGLSDVATVAQPMASPITPDS